MGFYQTLKNMVKKEGFSSLLKGLEASLILVINPIVQFIIYEHIKTKLPSNKRILIKR